MPADGPITSPSQVDDTLLQPSDPSTPGLTPSDVGLGNSPTNIAEWNTPQYPVAPTNPLTTPVQSPGMSASVMTKGMTDRGLARSGGLFGAADAKLAQWDAADAARTAVDQATSQRDYADIKDATGQQKTVIADFSKQEQILKQRQADFQMHAADVEERIGNEAKAERAKYLATYGEQLAGVRQLAAQSGNPYTKMTPGQAMGLAGAQFAQGFLAARGIHIDVSGQVDRWVDRSIQEHQQAIQNAREGAQDTLHLYEIARQSSQDDWEARQRYRGFVIEGLKTSVEMNASKFQSSLATANANVSIAKLQADADTTARSIGDAHFNRFHQEAMMLHDEAFKQGTLAIEQQKAAIEAAKVKAVKPDKLPAYVTDESQFKVDANGKQITGGKIIGVYNPDAPGATKAAESISGATLIHNRISNGVDRLMELKPKGASWSKFLSATESPEYRRFDASRSALIADLLLAKSGKAVTDAEYQRYLKMLPDNSKWQSGDNLGNLAEMKASTRAYLQSTIASERAAGNIRTLQANEPIDPRFGASADRYTQYEQGIDPVGRAVDDADLHGGAPKTSFAEVETGAALAKDKAVTEPSRLYSELIAQSKDEKQPHNTIPVELLARAYLHPAEMRSTFKDSPHGLPEDDATVQRQALDGLSRLVDAKDPTVSAYATMILGQLKDDPQGIDDLLQPNFTATYDDPTKDPRRTRSGHTPK